MAIDKTVGEETAMTDEKETIGVATEATEEIEVVEVEVIAEAEEIEEVAMIEEGVEDPKSLK